MEERIIRNIILLPFKLAWDILIIIAAVGLEIARLGFVFGSVLGVILILIFAPSLFLLPFGLFGLLVPIRDEY